MPRRRDDNQVQREPVLGTLQHPKRLPKAEVPKNIHRQITAPVAHILRPTPPLLLHHLPSSHGPNRIIHAPRLIYAPRPDNLAESPRVGKDVSLHLLDGIVREGLRQHAPLARVQLPVPSVVRVGRWVHEGVVEVRLADVGAVGVDCAKGRGGVEGEGVGSEADDGAWRVSLLVFRVFYVLSRDFHVSRVV